MLILFFMLVLSAPVHAASLVWDQTADGTLHVEYSATCADPYSFVLAVPANPPRFALTPGKFGCYRLVLPEGPTSNVARFFVDVVAELPSTPNLSTKMLDADRLEIIGLNCSSLSTSGTGLKRIVTCKH